MDSADFGNSSAASATTISEAAPRGLGSAQRVVSALPAGVRHSESNQGWVEVVGVIELRPALGTKEMFEAFAEHRRPRSPPTDPQRRQPA